jgi:hypothetical protein
MNRKDLVGFLPLLHSINEKEIKNLQKAGQKGLGRYQILRFLKRDTAQLKQAYSIINECIDMGLLKRVNDNPPEFLPEKEKIWKLWKETPCGIKCIEMVNNHRNDVVAHDPPNE